MYSNEIKIDFNAMFSPQILLRNMHTCILLKLNSLFFLVKHISVSKGTLIVLNAQDIQHIMVIILP